MGVLNVTPDSFSDGGTYFDPDIAVARALQLEQQGADIVDIGAESTKPDSQRISAGEELRRLIPVLKRLKERLTVPISVDTYKTEVAEKALEHGASIINDVSALTWEPDIVKPVVKYDAGLILNHMRGTPETWARLAPMKDVMGTLAAELEAAVHRATRGGVARERIVIDPGIGFGKRGEQNSEILARLMELQRLGFPILVAPSRKSFLAQKDPRALEFATASAVAVAILHGAAIVRVHDVAAMKPVVQTVDAVVQTIPEREEKPKPAGRVRLDSEVQAERRKQPVRPLPVAKAEPAAAPPSPPAETREGDRRRPIFSGEEKGRDDRPRRPFERRPSPPADRRPERPAYQGRKDDRKPEDNKRPFRGEPGKRPFQRAGESGQQGRRNDRPFEKRDRPFRPRDEERGDRPPAGQRFERGDRPFPPRGKRASGPSDSSRPGPKRTSSNRSDDRGPKRRDSPQQRSFGPKRKGGGPPKRGGGPRKRS